MSLFGLVSKRKYDDEINYLKEWYKEKSINLFGKDLFDYSTCSSFISDDITYDIPGHVISETREELNINEKQMSIIICDFFTYMITMRYFVKNDLKQNIPIFPISSKATDILWKNFMTTEEYIDFCQKNIGKYIPRTVGNKYLTREYTSTEKYYILKAIEGNKKFFMYRHHSTQYYLENTTKNDDDFILTYLQYSILFEYLYSDIYPTHNTNDDSNSRSSEYSDTLGSSSYNYDTHSDSDSSSGYSDSSYNCGYSDSSSSCGSGE